MASHHAVCLVLLLANIAELCYHLYGAMVLLQNILSCLFRFSMFLVKWVNCSIF